MRPSLKSRIVYWYVYFFFHKHFTSASNLRARIAHERKTCTHHPPDRLRRALTIQERQYRGHAVFDVSAPDLGGASDGEPPRVLYIHGGSFVSEIAEAQWDFAAALTTELRAVVTVPIYPLGPEHSLLEMYDFLQPLHDEMAAASAAAAVAASARNSSPFWLIGDSAGATLALGLTQQALILHRSLADRLVLSSPWPDATLSNPSIPAAEALDPWLASPGLLEAARAITTASRENAPGPAVPLDDPRISPLFGTMRGLPPVLVTASELDMLGPDAKRLAGLIEEHGGEVVLLEGEEMVHNWLIMPIWEGVQARKQMYKWLLDGRT